MLHFAFAANYCDLSCDFFEEKISHTVCDRKDVKCGARPNCGSDFKVIPLNKALRRYVVDMHNYLRNKVALGDEKRGEQPKAADMSFMEYNEELEYIAQCWANACNGNPLLHDNCRRTEKYNHVGQNLGFINSSISFDKSNQIKPILKSLIFLWYDEVKNFNNQWINKTENREDVVVGHYTQLIWAQTTEIGCALSYYTTFNNRKWHHLLLVCNYGPGGNYLGLPVYTIGEPRSKCSKNSRKNRFYKGLCGGPKENVL